VQLAAYASESQLYNHPHRPALTQALDELQVEMLATAFYGVRTGGRLLGSVRVTSDGEIAEIGRLVVAPDQHAASAQR